MSRHIHLINGVSGIAFAGAWMGFGFREDGFRAGVHAARVLIDGWEKTPPLNLTGDSAQVHAPRTGLMRRFLKLVVLIVWKLLSFT